MKNSTELASAIRLGEAYFCLSCEVVTNCVDICPACGNRKLWPLENWLGNVHGHEKHTAAPAELRAVHPAGARQVPEDQPGKNYWQMIGLSGLKS